MISGREPDLSEMLDKIIERADGIAEDVIKFRRQIHKNPETGGREKKTSSFVAGVLETNDIVVQREVGGFGVTGLLKGRDEGPVIALRADMDALPIQDKKESEYASSIPGVMHACGHDVHTAILMGTAVVLGSLRYRLNGSVKFIFQPSEENSKGAEAMIKSGVLENPAPSAIVALHCLPELEAGKIGIRPGMMSAAADRVRIVIKGRSGHASRPHQTVDAVLVSSMVINAIHHIVSRRTDPLHPAVISIGTIKGGTAENIVADNVEMEGTVRTLDPGLRKKIPDMIEEVVKGITSAMGAECEFHYSLDCPSVINDVKVNDLVRRCAMDIVGDDNVLDLSAPMMGSEDFALFAEKIPGVLFRLGTGNKEKGITSPLHNSGFDVDEDCISIGVKLMTWIALKYLQGNLHPGIE